MRQIVFKPKAQAQHSPRWHAWALIGLTVQNNCGFLWEIFRKGNSHEISERYITKFWRSLLEGGRIELQVTGLEHIDPKCSYLYMSNHESALDIPAIFGAIPQPVRTVAKEALFKIPVFGPTLRAMGFVPIDRHNLHKAKKQLETAKNTLQAGMSMWIAPEGTRNRDSKLLPFKKGGFHVALGLGIPIIPMYVKNSAQIAPSNRLLVFPGKTIEVFFGEPIQTSALEPKDLLFLMQRVRMAILELENKN